MNEFIVLRSHMSAQKRCALIRIDKCLRRQCQKPSEITKIVAVAVVVVVVVVVVNVGAVSEAQKKWEKQSKEKKST